MISTDAAEVYVIIDPTVRDVLTIGRIARDTDCRIIAHPDTCTPCTSRCACTGP
jgi:hypothetical protein